jgi:long-chain fatty acid transport protein
MKLAYLTTLGALALSTTAAHSGGWETGRLSTAFLYQEGSYLESSFADLNYSINGKIQDGTTHKMAKDQRRMSASGKFQIGNLDIGLTSFGSGAIQMDGQAAAANPSACGVEVFNLGVAGAAYDLASAAYAADPADSILLANARAAGAGVVAVQTAMEDVCSYVPSADVKVDTNALIARYRFNENFSVIGGVRQAKIQASSVTTMAANYAINSRSKTGMVYGIAYERPDIALRLEVLRSEGINIGLEGSATASAATPLTGTMVVPEATTVNFQTGIAKDTLLMASAHKVGWGVSQIEVQVPAMDALNIASEFSNSTSYSLGLGRKLSEQTSASLTYSWENGSKSTSGSAFSMSNGSKTLSAGVSHKINALTLSGGISYTKVGDVEVTSAKTALTSSYTGNSVTAVGVKIGYNF